MGSGSSGMVIERSDIPANKKEIISSANSGGAENPSSVNDKINFPLDYLKEIQQLPLTGNPKKDVKIITKALSEKILDEKETYIKEVTSKTKDKFLKRGAEIDTSKVSSLKKCEKNPFVVKTGATTHVAWEISQEHPGAKISIEVFADQTYWGCGIFSNWTTQEESTIRDSSPDLMAWLIGNNYVTKVDRNKGTGKAEAWHLEYVEKENGLATSDGYLIQGNLCLDGLKPMDVPLAAFYLFTSMPSFSNKKVNFDEKGAFSWLYKYREYKALKAKKSKKSKKKSSSRRSTETETKKDLFKAWVSFFIKKAKEGIFKDESPEDFRNILLILMFGDYEIKEDEEGGEFEETLGKLVELKNSDDVLSSAQRHYEALVRKSVASWVIMAREAKIDYFIGGPVGCGAFFNDPQTIAKIVAEEFIKYGGDMTFVYSAFNDKDDKKGIFQKAFEEAFEGKDEDE